MTPAQRRWKWVKKDRLPAYILAQMGGKGKADKEVKETKETRAEAAKRAADAKERGAEDASKVQAALGVSAQDKEAKETNLNKKNDFQVDYSKTENVSKKLKEI